MRKIKLIDCKQIRSDLPIFEGRCSDNGDVIQVVDLGTAREGCRVFYNDGLRRGLALGAVATLVGLATAWTINKMIFSEDKEED